MTLDTAYPAGVTLTSTQTLTNKRITPRVGTVASSATPTINTDNVDIFEVTALTTAITSMTSNLSGTPTEGQELIINITGTAARAITWGASFEDSAIALPTTTVTTAMLSVFLRWNSATSKWRCMGATVAGGVTYPLIGSLGAVGAPTYSFTGGVDGMWSSAANTLDFSAAGVRGLQIAAGGNNYVKLFGSNSEPTIDITGSSTNIGVFLRTKGAGFFDFYSHAGAAEMFKINPTASAVNHIETTPAATGNAPSLSAVGSNTDVDLALIPQGSGLLKFGTASASIATPSTHKIAIKAADGTTYYLLVTT